MDAIYSERRALIASGVILIGTVLLAASAMNPSSARSSPTSSAPSRTPCTGRSSPSRPSAMATSCRRRPWGDRRRHGSRGLVMLALPVGIIASAFSREIHRRDFVITWSMVARVPIFSDLAPDEVASIMHSLRSQSCEAGEVKSAGATSRIPCT